MTRKRKPPTDPRIAAAQLRAEKAAADYERWYGRLRRALARMEMARKTRARALRLIERITAELEARDAVLTPATTTH